MGRKRVGKTCFLYSPAAIVKVEKSSKQTDVTPSTGKGKTTASWIKKPYSGDDREKGVHGERTSREDARGKRERRSLTARTSRGGHASLKVISSEAITTATHGLGRKKDPPTDPARKAEGGETCHAALFKRWNSKKAPQTKKERKSNMKKRERRVQEKK